jgi:DNA-directed RNA polymerase subunit RPC12/RpoP
MADPAAQSGPPVVCPHCGKEFEGELLVGASSSGFKCPHCRLFVPAERAVDPNDV